jgi:AcrR family transcriptional regulator
MSSTSLDATPRKQPRQARSKATVDAVITAAAQVLSQRGYEGATTARIAERAGVSIGSLYQYFPNKEALIAALIEQHAGQIVTIMQQALDDPGSATLEDGLKALIHAGAKAHQIDPNLHKILQEQVPKTGRLAQAMDASQQITAAIERFLRAHADEMHPERDPSIAAMIIETAIEAIGHKAVNERQDLLRDGTVEREAFCLAASYVSRAYR